MVLLAHLERKVSEVFPECQELREMLVRYTIMADVNGHCEEPCILYYCTVIIKYTFLVCHV